MKIGFIGLGNVGAKLAGSLLRNNFDLTVIDLDKNITKHFASRGAKIIEKHLTFDNKIKGPDISCSMNSEELKDLIRFSKIVMNASSKNDDFLKEENVTRNFAFHSVVSNEEIQKGERRKLAAICNAGRFEHTKSCWS